MADILESNVLLRSRVTGPEGRGLANLKRHLDALEKQLERISSKEYKITFVVDDQGLRHSNLQIVGKKIGDNVKESIKAGANQAFADIEKRDVKVRVVTKEGKEGPVTTVTRTQQTVSSGKKVTTSQSTSGTETVEREDLAERERQRRRVREAQEATKKKIDAEQGIDRDRLAREKDLQRTFGVGGAADRRTVDERNRAARAEEREVEQARKRRSRAYNKYLQRQAVEEIEAPGRDAVREQREIDAIQRRRSRAFNRLQQRQAVAEVEAPGKDAERERKEVDRILARRQARASRLGVKAAVQEAELEQGRIQAFKNITGLREQGFKESGTRETFNPRTGRSEITSEFQKVSRVGLGQYEVVVSRVNRSTGDMTQHLHKGARAARLIGDNFQHAVEKVSLWLAATGTIFTVVRGLQDAVRVTLELEEATTLLARVAKNYGDNFKQRMPGAQRVQQETVRFATITGGDPEEAMRAAAVFARAGQSVEQTIQSVRASMIAARIAELGVLEAAELLSAAYLQFGMSGESVLPILNQLNTLSNNYRVTTDDLLQAISRSGSIFAQQHGRLSELAAITAVTSQVTARSGAEIGNAMKTIASNLERVETQNILFERLGVTTVDLEGSTKSYSRVLSEMQVALGKVTEAERNQIGVSVAGVRQRNILLAQLQNVTEIIKAENLTLLGEKDSSKAGSALDELQESSTTLTASLGRLRGEALKLTTEGGGPLVDVAKEAVAVLTLMLQILSSGNGMVAKMATWAVIMVVVVHSLKLLKTQISEVTIASIQAAASHLKQALAAQVAGNASATAASQFKLATAAMKELAVSAILVAGKYIAFFLIIQIVTEWLMKQQQGQELLNRAMEGGTDETERAIQKEVNRGKAIQNTALRVAELTEEINNLQVQQQRDPTQRNAQLIANYRAEIEDLMKSLRMPVGNKSLGDINRQLIEEDEKTIRASIEAREKKIKALRGKIALANPGDLRRQAGEFKLLEDTGITYAAPQSELGKSTARGMNPLTGNIDTEEFARQYFENYRKAQEGDLDAIRELQKQTQDFSTTSLGMETTFGRVSRLAEEHTKAKSSIQEFTAAINEEEAAIRSSSSGLEDYIKNQLRYNELAKVARNILEQEANRKIEREGTEALRSFFGDTKDFAMVQGEINRTQGFVTELATRIDQFPLSGTKKFQEILIAQQKILREQRNQMMAIQIQSITGAVGGDLGGVRSINNALVGSAWQRRLAERREPGMVGGLNKIAAEQAAVQRNLEELELTAENRRGDAVSRAVEGKEIQRNIQEELIRMADLEVQKASELFNVEAQIAIERKKSADEAARALGVLSDTDKMRAVAQAAYFARNPDKRVSFEEQFAMRGEDVSLGRNLFGGRFEDRLDPARSPLAAGFARAGLGGSYDLERSAARASDFRAGRTDEEIIRDARRRSAMSRAAASEAGGGMAISPSYTMGGGAANRRGEAFIPALNVNATIDFRPVVSELTTLFSEEVQQAVDEMRKTFADDIRRDRDFRHTPVPAGTNPT